MLQSLIKSTIKQLYVLLILSAFLLIVKACPTSYPDVTVTAFSPGLTVWGSSPYTDDSDIAKAAVHFGIMKICQTAVIQKNAIGFYSSYSSSTNNGVSTVSWSFSFCGVTLSLVSLVNSNPKCILYDSSCTCLSCCSGCVNEIINGAIKCVRPEDKVRNCLDYTVLADRSFQCSTCESSPNIAKYYVKVDGILAYRCLNTLTEYISNCQQYSFISQTYSCRKCITGYELVNVVINSAYEKCLNSATEVMSNCIAYGINSTNNYECTECANGYTLKIISGAFRCLPNARIDSNCQTYVFINPNFQCNQCNPSYNLADVYTILGTFKTCIQTIRLIRDCLVYESFTGGYQCRQCATITNIAKFNGIFNSISMKRCINTLTQIVSSCSAYTIADPYICSSCSYGFTLKPISGISKCLPNVVIDPQCITYILNGANYQCSLCNSMYSLSNVLTNTGTYKQCLLNTALIRECIVYKAFSGGYECNQCQSVSNLVLKTSLFNSVSMARCLDSLNELVQDCSGYNIENPYTCSTCDVGFTLKPISGISKCLPNAVIDTQCTTYIFSFAAYECSACSATYTVTGVLTGTAVYKYCLLTSVIVRDCSVHEPISGGYQCNQCSTSPNIVLVNTLFNSVQTKRCLNSVTQVVPECTGYTIANPYVCSACNSGFTLKPISGVPKCLPNIVIDPQCTTYIQNATSSAYECSVCNSTFTVSDVFTATGTYKYCISNDKLIRDCILYQRFSRGQECKQCSASANIALHNFLYNGMQMNRCLNDLTEHDGNCTSYRFTNQVYYCISCVANYALKMNSGGPVRGICVECKYSIFKCTACNPNLTCSSCQYPYILGPTGLCDKCQAGFQYVDTLCVKPVGCQSFLSDYSKCLACFGKYHFVYSPAKDACICDLHYKLATVDNKTVCINQCGDGVITPPEEECDDQNTRNDDGCDQNCRVEKDFVCSSISPSSCKLQYKASTLKHNYVYKVEEKNRCRFSFSLFPVHPVFQYLDWEKYLHLNISASSEYVVPGSVSYSYEASTQEIFVQFDYEQSLEGMTVEAKFSTANVPVTSSLKQVMTDAMEGDSMKTSNPSNPNNREFMSVKTSSLNTVVLEIISITSELTAVFNVQGINIALQSQEMSMIKAYQVGCTVSLIISIFFLLQFFIGSYVHKMIGLETLQILQLLYFSRVIIEQKHTQFLHSMNYLKYAAYGGYSNYGLVYQTESPEPINLSYMTVNKKFLSAGLMKFYTLNVNLSLAFPILGLLYFAFTFIRKIYKRNQYLESRDQSEKDEYTILRRSSQSAYDHFVFPLINLFNFAAFFCTILYLQSKSSQNSSQRQFKTSEETEKIESTSFLPLICTLFISIFVFCLQIFNSYEDFMHSCLTQKQKKHIPKSLIQKIQHDRNNPNQPNYKPLYVLVYLFYYLIIQMVILTGVFAQQSQVSVSCEMIAFLNLVYLIIIWRWQPYCANTNFHNKVLRLNHLTSLIFLLICICMKLINCEEIVWVSLFYFVFFLLVFVGISGFIRIYLEYQFRNKLKDEIKQKEEQELAKLKLKLMQNEKNPFLLQNQDILQKRLKNQLPQLNIQQIQIQMIDQIFTKKQPKLTLENYIQKQLKRKRGYYDPLEIRQDQSKLMQYQNQKLFWKETAKYRKQKFKITQERKMDYSNQIPNKDQQHQKSHSHNR